MFSLDQKLTLESFHSHLFVVFGRTNFFKSSECFFQKLESSMEVQRAKRKFPDNHGHNILELHNVLIQTRLTTSETKRDIQYSKLGIRVASQVAEWLKTQHLRKIGNIGKFLNLVGDIAQSPVSLPKIKLWQQKSKNTQKQISNFSGPVQFYWISPFCSKYFAKDCSQLN